MDDPGGVRGGERAGDLRADVQRPHHVERDLARQRRRERPALEVFHDVEVVALRRHAEVMDLDDVLVADLVDRAGFLEEPRHDVAIAGQLVVDHLERHPLADQRVLREVDRTHPTRPDLVQDAIVTDGLTGRDHEPAGSVSAGPSAVCRCPSTAARPPGAASPAGPIWAGHAASGSPAVPEVTVARFASAPPPEPALPRVNPIEDLELVVQNLSSGSFGVAPHRRLGPSWTALFL
jgi:hypothetical protein